MNFFYKESKFHLETFSQIKFQVELVPTEEVPQYSWRVLHQSYVDSSTEQRKMKQFTTCFTQSAQPGY